MAINKTKALVMPTQTLIRPKIARGKKQAESPSLMKTASKKNETSKDLAKTYNEFKQFEGAQYTGMKIGRSHK